MTSLHNFESPPDVAADARLADELVKRARKLRWIGPEAAAEALFAEPRRFDPGSASPSAPSATG